MASTAPARRAVDTAPKAGDAAEKLAKYRAMRCSLDRCTRGKPEELRAESKRVSESLREERALANGLLLKRK